jgi:hypothetical protein
MTYALPATLRRLDLGQLGALGDAHRLSEMEMRTANSTVAAISAAAGAHKAVDYMCELHRHAK